MPGPGRPPNERDLFMFLNGCPNYLGVLVSAGAAVNNATTATPFNQTPLGANASSSVGPVNLTNTLAGKVVLIQTTVDGYILPSQSNAINIVDQSAPPPIGSTPGLLVGANERVITIMLPTAGWLQWLPAGAGSGICFVWELL